MPRLPRVPKANLGRGLLTPTTAPPVRRALEETGEPLEAPFQEWDDFLDGFRWRQGEHVSILGKTGGGKTTLALQLLPMRRYAIALGTKSRDPVLYPELERQGFHRQAALELIDPDVVPKILVVPPLPDTSAKSKARQRAVFANVLDETFRYGRYALFLDEAAYIAANPMRLGSEMELLWLQGRSLLISIMAITQRPADVPLEMYSMATHLFLFRNTDARDVARLGEIGGSMGALLRHEVPRLAKHDVLYFNTDTDERVRTRAPKIA